MYSVHSDNETRAQTKNEVWRTEKPGLQNVYALIDRMQNINLPDNTEEILLKEMIFAFGHKRVGVDIIKHIVKKGGNVNYEEEGFNCLYEAVLTIDYELVKFLLIAGANPNCISDERESLLDWVEFDYRLELGDGHLFAKGYEPIIELLKTYGAKSARELNPSLFDKL